MIYIVKRVYDCALWFSGNMNIEMNIKKKEFKFTNECNLNNEEISMYLDNYINLYTNGEINKEDIIIDTVNRWEIGVVLSKNYKYMQTSMVNGITTTRGGKHVDNIVNQIVKKLNEISKKKKKCRN